MMFNLSLKWMFVKKTYKELLMQNKILNFKNIFLSTQNA